MIAWTIAGSDSGGGAGIQADLKTFAAHNVLGCSVITLITAQNTNGVTAVSQTDPHMVTAQLKALAQDLQPAAVKIGALGSAATAAAVAEHLAPLDTTIVLDPVLKPSRGFDFSQDGLIPVLTQKLFPLVTLLTPNIPEAETLLGRTITNRPEMVEAAEALVEMGVESVLLKGGHMNGPFSHDYWTDGNTGFWLTTPRLDQESPHGTGCVLSSAVTACLAQGMEMSDALVAGRAFLNRSVRKSITPGSGAGVVNPHADLLLSQDMPVLTPRKDPLERSLEFPSCGPEPLGFYPIVDRCHWLKRILPLGVTTVQLRIKDLEGAALDAEIKEAVALCEAHRTRLFVNDYWQAAVRYGAYGVHLGQEDLERADLEALAAAGLRLGLSTHSHTEVARALALNPSYAACGPIYETTTKEMRFGPQGLERLAMWQACLDIPLVAIGGISMARAPKVLETGVESIAVVSAVTKAADPEAAVREWLNLFSQNHDGQG